MPWEQSGSGYTTKDRGGFVRHPSQYEKLRSKGMSKERAARIVNKVDNDRQAIKRHKRKGVAATAASLGLVAPVAYAPLVGMRTRNRKVANAARVLSKPKVAIPMATAGLGAGLYGNYHLGQASYKSLSRPKQQNVRKAHTEEQSMKTPYEIAKSDALWVRDDVEKASFSGFKSFASGALGGTKPKVTGRLTGAKVSAERNFRKGAKARATVAGAPGVARQAGADFGRSAAGAARSGASAGARGARMGAARIEGPLRTGTSSTRGRMIGLGGAAGGVGLGGGYAAGNRRKKNY